LPTIGSARTCSPSHSAPQRVHPHFLSSLSRAERRDPATATIPGCTRCGAACRSEQWFRGKWEAPPLFGRSPTSSQTGRDRPLCRPTFRPTFRKVGRDWENWAVSPKSSHIHFALTAFSKMGPSSRCRRRARARVAERAVACADSCLLVRWKLGTTTATADFCVEARRAAMCTCCLLPAACCLVRCSLCALERGAPDRAGCAAACAYKCAFGSNGAGTGAFGDCVKS